MNNTVCSNSVGGIKAAAILCLLAVILPTVSQGGVYDDDSLVLWLRGDSDLNNDGRIQVGEVVDARSPVATSAITPTGWLDGTVSGESGDFAWTNDVVVCPYTFRTNENAKAYCFRQSVRSANNGVMPNTISLDSSVASRITSDAWSFHMRFKWHGKTISTKTGSNDLLWVGNSSTDDDGHGFKMFIVSAGSGTGILKCAIGDTEFMSGNIGNSVRLSSNIWTDVVFTMTATNFVEWAIMQEGTALTEGSCSPGDLKFRPSPTGNVLIGHSAAKTAWGNYLDSAAYYNAFIGEVASFAMWDGALSPEDRIRAMAWPNEDLFRAGIGNGSSEEFDGEGGVSSSALDPDCGWGGFGGDFASGDSKSIAVWVPVRYDGLPQVLRYRAASDSAHGRLTLSVNGDGIGDIAVSPGVWSSIIVPAQYFASGETTTLAMTRTDGGASAVKTDVIALGGSWQEGTVSGNQWENKNATAQEPYYLPDGNFTHFRDAIFAGTQQSVRFDLGSELVSRYRFKVAYKMQFGKIPADIKVRAYINEELAYAEDPTTKAWAWEDREFAVPVNLLREGENILTFANEGADSGETQTYFSFDYLRLLVDKKKAGIIVIVR